jgi:hypothetical protein
MGCFRGKMVLEKVSLWLMSRRHKNRLTSLMGGEKEKKNVFKNQKLE